MESQFTKDNENLGGLEINKRKMNLQRQVVEKLRVEIEKRDKILDVLVSGGDVTLVNSSNGNGVEEDNVSKLGTKTFELLIKTKVPYKVETVTLGEINWDEPINSYESSQVSLLSQDIKPEPVLKLTDVNETFVQKENPLRAAKRHLSKSELESDATSTTLYVNRSEPDGKQAKLEEKQDCDLVNHLPEFSIDQSFFETKNPSATTSKLLIRLHDNNTDKICLYDISNSRGSKSISAQKFELSIQEIQAAINVQTSSNPGSILKIWCDVKDFDIFSDSALQFFQCFGKFMSHFTFFLGYSPDLQKSSPASSSIQVDSNFLIGFILQNFPNLEFLSIDFGMLTNLDDLKLNANFPTLANSSPLKLLGLKTLKIVQSKLNQPRISSTFLAKLLKRAPRLESLYGIPLDYIKETAELDKILMEDSIIEDPLSWIDSPAPKLKIRSVFIQREIYFNQPHKFIDDLLNLCHFETGTGRIIVALEEFRAQSYFVTETKIRKKAGQAMSRILQMNRESLLKLTLEPNRNPQLAMEIPRLENVKIIRFDFVQTNFSSFFPRGFQQSQIFPKLEQVEMFREQQFRHGKSPPKLIEPSDFLRRGETFETVQSVSLVNIAPPAGTGTRFFMKIRSMFPNLTKLMLNNSLYEIARFLQPVFRNFAQLHQLVLEIDTDIRPGNLDAALTGIKMDLCKKLENFVPCPIEGNGKETLIQIIRNGRSLSDLNELRLLKLVLRSGVSRELNKIPVMTPVSFEYGFGPEQLKNVKIFLDFHEKTSREVKSDILTAMGPVLPFMTVL